MSSNTVYHVAAKRKLNRKWNNGLNGPWACRLVWPVQPIIPFPVLNLLQSLGRFLSATH